jgi:hypothetical protein
MSSSANRLRETVEATRTNDSENPVPPINTNLDNNIESGNLNVNNNSQDLPDTPRGFDQELASSSPTTAAGDGNGALKSRSENNLRSIMEFVSKLTSASSNEPKMTLEILLDTMGFVKDVPDSSDDEDDSSDSKSMSSSSISFNFGASDSSAATFSPLRNLNSILNRFSSELAHRCWIENNPHLLSREQQEAREAGVRPKKAEVAELQKVMVPWRG